MSLHKIHILLIFLFLWVGSVTLAAADGGTLFFTTIVEQGNLGTPQVVLEWGALDGKLPTEINSFKLYRSTNGGNHDWLADINHTLAAADNLKTMVQSDLPSRTTSLIENLDRMSGSEGGEVIDNGNFADYLHGLLDPISPSYNSLKVMLLSRAHLSAARAQGLAFIDNSVNASSTYHYILTAVTAGGESQPIGQSGNVDPSQETILPAPTGLAQVRLSECSALGGGLDDNKINLRWHMPSGPQNIGLNAVTYGYELFWSTSDLGVVDFRQTIPANLYRVIQEPVVVAGAPPVDGPDSYLAKDGPENHNNSETGPAWKRGQSYFYYLTARDIAGHYSAPVSAVELTVEDGKPPRAIWNAHVREVKDPNDNETPRLALMWDAPTARNFTRYYGTNRNICSATTEEVCWVSPEQSCNTDTPRCADLEVDHYDIFRFDSPQQATDWGIDTDGDGWPDNQDSEPCNPEVHPSGIHPAQWVATIDPDDGLYTRALTENHDQIFYIDDQEEGIPQLNKVYWYKILAVDATGNQSPLSPSIRGVLYDRSQPDPSATISRQNCSYSADLPGDCGVMLPEDGDAFIVRDTTGKAKSYKLLQVCGLTVNGITMRVLDSGQVDSEGVARIKSSSLPTLDLVNKCVLAPCNGFQTVVVRFYDKNGEIVDTTPGVDLVNSCSYQGCATLNESCTWEEIDESQPIVDDSVQVCVPLEAGQSARVYYETPGGMSAFHTFPPATLSGEVCEIFDDFAGLTPADICLGVRVFSENHVGSIMQYLGCLELPAQDKQPPPRPLLDAPEAMSNGDGDFFNLHWSMPTAGIGSYILKISSADGSSYQSLWDIHPDDSGRYPYPYQLNQEDIAKEWCFQVRALATDMQVSEWSNEQCDTWSLGEQENLPWPPVAEPEIVEGESIGAFYMENAYDHYPVLVLSDNLAPITESLLTCNSIPSCGIWGIEFEPGISPCMGDMELTFYNCPVSSLIESNITASNFIVYRQQSGHDFVQVSPLIEGFHSITTVDDKLTPVDHLQDPFITFMNIHQEIVTGVSDAAAIGTGVRVLFKDRYPFKGGTDIRYKLVSINHKTGEPEKVFTSNWVSIP